MDELHIFETHDGSHSIFSDKFGVSYHSKYGAVRETQHVFIDAALRFKAVLNPNISILEMGFGTGLNALMTYLEARKRNLNVYYQTIEAYPITLEQAQYLNFNAVLDTPAACRHTLSLLHELSWGDTHTIDTNFSFHKQRCLFEDAVINHQFDIIYFDAFAPTAQPTLWEAPLMQKMYDALAEDGILVTYCAKGEVKRTLRSVGFELESLAGPPGKREMTRALKVKKHS